MEAKDNERIPLRKRIEAASRMLRFQTLETVANISRDLQISRSHLYVLERKYDEDQTMADRLRDGRPKKVDAGIKICIQKIFIKKFHSVYRICIKIFFLYTDFRKNFLF